MCTIRLLSLLEKLFFNRSFNYSECLPVTDRQGDILMGTEGGMLVFSPDSIVKQTYEAPIVVTGIKYSEDNLSHVLSDADYFRDSYPAEEFYHLICCVGLY